MSSKKWTITKTEIKEEKIENINNISDEEFAKIMDEKFTEINKIKTETESKITKLEFKLGETPYRKLTDDVIEDEILEGSSIATFWITLTMFEVLILTCLAGFFGLKDFSNFPYVVGFVSIIAFSIINHGFSKIRHEKVVEFIQENFRKSKLFKTKYIKAYRRFDFVSDNNTWNYYIKFYDENEKIRKLKVSKIAYETASSTKCSRHIYVLKMPIYRLFIKEKYVIFFSEHFENLSSIPEQSKYNIRHNINTL